MTNDQPLKKLTEEISRFIDERDWQQFHSPKNLAMALSVEVAELTEIFQWLSEKESYTPDKKTYAHIEEEVGDIMIYLSTIANKFDIDPINAAVKKMQKNREKYPADKVRGKSDKYDRY